MKSAIAVCGLIATFIAVQPVFANEKAREHKNAKPAAAKKTAVAPKKGAPKKGAVVKAKAKPSPPKQPWLGRNVAISESERHVIRWYVRGRMDASKGGKFHGVPQGLAKKVAWFNTLPPGWEK